MNKTVGAVTVGGFDPVFLNVERDGGNPEKLNVTLRGDKKPDGTQPIALGTFTKEDFALFLVRCQQQL